MKPMNPWIPLIAAALPTCHCERTIEEGTDADAATTTGTTSESLTAASTTAASESSTGPAFDASRWIGRYHYEDAWLEFGERGDPLGAYMLVNFEILPDSTATMVYDECAFDVPITIAYDWTPDEPGWIELHPGAGESSLRLLAAQGLESLRVHLVEPCRELQFEVDGVIPNFFLIRPGESCWYDRCLAAGMMRVDYCPGEEPPPCP